MIPAFTVPMGQPIAVEPPQYFRPTQEPIKRAVLGDWTRTQTGLTPAQRAGARYEKRIHAALRERYKYKYHESQVIEFEDHNGAARCIPDGLIKELAGICIIEIKSQHMPESWWQLRKKYEPLVRHIWPGQRVILLEICRALDAAMPYPEEFETIESIDSFIVSAKDGALGVLQWKL